MGGFAGAVARYGVAELPAAGLPKEAYLLDVREDDEWVAGMHPTRCTSRWANSAAGRSRFRATRRCT